MVNHNETFERCRIIFRNFAGKEGKFNPAGRRNFCVLIDTDRAEQMIEEGWNVRWLRPRDEEEEPQGYLQVSVSYNVNPPKIVLISSSGKTLLDEDSIDLLDWAEIENVDLIIRPYNWEVNGRTGVKAYVKSMYITIAEDEFEKKYRDTPDSAQSAMMSEDLPF